MLQCSAERERERVKSVPLVHVMVDGPRHEDGYHGSERLALAVEVVRRYRVQFLLVRVPSQFLQTVQTD